MKAKILVIDDNNAVRETICENLSADGFEVYEAPGGEQGMQLIAQGLAPQVVVTDIIMPKKEGLEVIMELRKNFPSIKIIAVSGGARIKDMSFLSFACKLGADAALPKPIDMDALIATIRKMI